MSGKPSDKLRIFLESAIRFGESFRRRHNLSEISFIRFLSDFIMRNTSRGGRILVVRWLGYHGVYRGDKEGVEETTNALRNGRSPEEVIEAMSRSLIKKTMHNYLGNIRRLVEEGNEEMVRELRNSLVRLRENSRSPN